MTGEEIIFDEVIVKNFLKLVKYPGHLKNPSRLNTNLKPHCTHCRQLLKAKIQSST